MLFITIMESDGALTPIKGRMISPPPEGRRGSPGAAHTPRARKSALLDYRQCGGGAALIMKCVVMFGAAPGEPR